MIGYPKVDQVKRVQLKGAHEFMGTPGIRGYEEGADGRISQKGMVQLKGAHRYTGDKRVYTG